MNLVADNYPVEPSRATLVRSFNNEVYRIDAAGSAHALKIYGSGRFTADEVRWEQQLANELTNAGVPLAADVALSNGDSVGKLDVCSSSFAASSGALQRTRMTLHPFATRIL